MHYVGKYLETLKVFSLCFTWLLTLHYPEKFSRKKFRATTRVWSKISYDDESTSSQTFNYFLWSVLINQLVLSTFCLCFSGTSINFRGMLHHVCDVAYDENMCGPIRTHKYKSTNWLINYIFAFSSGKTFFPFN